MADETFELGLQVTGEDKASRSIENLKLKQIDLKEEAQKLAKALKELKDAGAATEEQIEEAARAMIRAQRAASQNAAEISKMERAQRAAANASRQQAVSFQDVAARMGAFSGALGQLGSIVAQTNPELAQLGRGLGVIGSSAGAGAAAFGPWGAAIGGLTGAIAALVTHLHEEERAHNAAARAQEDHARATIQHRSALETLLPVVQQRIRLAQAQAGALSVAEQERALAQASLELATHTEGLTVAERELDSAQAAASITQAAYNAAVARGADDVQRYRDQWRVAEARVAAARAEIERTTRAMAEGSTLVQSLQRGLENAGLREGEIERRRQEERAQEQRAQRAAANARRRAEERAEHERQQRVRQKEAENTAFDEQQRLREETARRQRELYNFLTELDQQYIDAQLERARRAADDQRAIEDKRKQHTLASAEEARAQLAATGQIVDSMWTDIGGSVMDVTGQMVKFIVSGAKGGEKAFVALLDQFLEATAIEYAIKGIGELANAAIAAASLNAPKAAAHATAAGMAFAVAAATGVAGAAIQSGPSAGGAPASPPAQATPAAPAPGGGGPVNITMQIFSPNAVFTEAERGEIFAGGLREARRQYGPGATRS